HCPLAGAQETRCKLLGQTQRQQNSISVLASLILLCNRRPILPSLCSCQGNGERSGTVLNPGGRGSTCSFTMPSSPARNMDLLIYVQRESVWGVHSCPPPLTSGVARAPRPRSFVSENP